MLNSSIDSLKVLVTNRTAHIFIVIHWDLFILALNQRQDPSLFEGDPHTFAPEPLLFQTLILLNLPAIFVAVVFLILLGLAANLLPTSIMFVFDKSVTRVPLYLLFAVFIICMSLQWIFIGYLLERMLRRKPKH